MKKIYYIKNLNLLMEIGYSKNLKKLNTLISHRYKKKISPLLQLHIVHDLIVLLEKPAYIAKSNHDSISDIYKI